MFEPYLRLCAARSDHAQFAREFESLIRVMAEPIERVPTVAEGLRGHVRHDMNMPVWKRIPHLFALPGLYVWGAWEGAASRVQYVGVAGLIDDAIIAGRFAGRYSQELRRAAKYGNEFRALPQSFRGEKRAPSEIDAELARCRSLGIPANRGKSTRLARSERFAKVGLENLWYFVVPARSERMTTSAGKNELRDVESLLTQCASERLFRAHQAARLGPSRC